MRRAIFVFLAFVLLSSGISAHTLDAEATRHLCRVAPPAEIAEWVPTRNTELEAYAKEFLRNTDHNSFPVLLCVSNDREATFAWNRPIHYGRETIFVFGISRYFMERTREHLRAIIAHEVGHEVATYKGGACERVDFLKDNDDYVFCEHDADWIGANWVGKPAMLSALEKVLSLMKADGFPQRTLDNVERRISLLSAAP